MKNHTFQPVSPQANFPELEEKILKYWKLNKIFEMSIELRPKNKTWTFLDGPPFITGLPHYGSLLSSIPKDVFPRFWTMKGYRVRRVWGWDCHGLPAENKVEDKLGLKRKRDIEGIIGVKKFIDECKLYVKDVSSEWEWYVDHIARWVDFNNAYKTMDLAYMETVMWVFKTMYDKGYIYKGLRVSLYCPHCSTPISNFEVAMDQDNYKTITEPATTYKYQLIDEPDTFILAWSTTPWNKIVTPALAINPKLKYVKVMQGNEKYILAKSALKQLMRKPFQELDEFIGKTLLGKKFIPHYDFYDIEPGKKAFEIVAGDFVTAEEGTGVVTIAAYGEEDLGVMQKENIQIVMHLDDEGNLLPFVPKWAGKYYLTVNNLVNEDLNSRGLIYKEDNYTHTVSTCWRCHTRLIYAPQDAWYVNVQLLKPKLKQTNTVVNWFPEHFKYGRYLKSLEAAPDWCISRSRYWGSPVPVWECKCGERIVPGSLAELEQLSGIKITDLHKPDIDNVALNCTKCGKKALRVPEVLDSWIEAGSAAFAERHFPFAFLKDDKNLKPIQESPALLNKLHSFFPPDFIVEYTGQIRAWFYVLHVIATALYNSHAFKNVVVTGVILGTDGRKMSKNYGNYPDPKEMLLKYGGDALRLYLMGSPVMHGEDIIISEDQYRNQVRGLMLVLWNVYNFFITYATVDNWSKQQINLDQSLNILDKWIFSRLQQTVSYVTSSLEAYNTVESINYLHNFIDDLSTWYIRRSRERVGPTALNKLDKENFYTTCYEVLIVVCRLAAPFIPFLVEEIYLNLTDQLSVHLSNWPLTQTQLIDQSILQQMKIIREITTLGHAQRKKANIKVRQPLSKITVHNCPSQLEDPYTKLIAEELNVEVVKFELGKGKISVDLDTKLTESLLAKGQMRELTREIQKLRKLKGLRIDQIVDLSLPSSYRNTLSSKMLEVIKKETLLRNIIWGEEFLIMTG